MWKTTKNTLEESVTLTGETSSDDDALADEEGCADGGEDGGDDTAVSHDTNTIPMITLNVDERDQQQPSPTADNSGYS